MYMFNYELPIINYQLSIINYQLPIINYQFLIIIMPKSYEELEQKLKKLENQQNHLLEEVTHINSEIKFSIKEYLFFRPTFIYSKLDFSNMVEFREGYYQGILQLRQADDDVVDFMINLVNNREDVAITKMTKVRGGVDYYITSNKFLRIS